MGAGAALLVGGVALVRGWREPAPVALPPSAVAVPVAGAQGGAGAPAPRLRRERPAPPVSVLPGTTAEALAAALNEERVVLASSLVIDDIERDRPWVCAGESMSLLGRVGGVPEPGVVVRWVWPGTGAAAELHPGARLRWRAPAVAGPAFVLFQACKDLGGRRVGVLAEQWVRIDVRDCGDGAEREASGLGIDVIQRANGVFLFRAVAREPAALTGGYAWDFGDGSTAVTAGPEVAHAYDTRLPDVRDVRTFTVRLTAGRGDGEAPRATAFVSVRGHPPPDEPHPATLELARTLATSEEWRSEVSVEVPEAGSVAWERVERLTLHWDDRVDVLTRDWREVITVEEDLGRGGFRGFVMVRPLELAATVKQVVDVLHGRDASGEDVSLSWASFKREAAPGSPGAMAPLPRKP